MNDAGKMLVIVGGAIAVVGIFLWSGMGRNWLGRLPGDFHFEKGNVKFYFPLATGLLLSLLLTIILRFFRRE